MHDIYKGAAKKDDKVINKFHPVKLAGIARHMGDMTFSLIDEVLSGHRITESFGKIVERPFAYRKIIGTPVRKKRAAFLMGAPNPDEIVEQRCKTDYGRVGMGIAPVFQPVDKIFACFRIPGVDLHQVFLIPLIGRMVIHGDFFPDTIGKKTDGIVMPRNGVRNGDGSFFPFIIPIFGTEQDIGRSVVNLPVLHGSRTVIDRELFFEKIIHQPDCQRCTVQIIVFRDGRCG